MKKVIKRHKEKRNIIFEMVSTEKTYNKNLDLL